MTNLNPRVETLRSRWAERGFAGEGCGSSLFSGTFRDARGGVTGRTGTARTSVTPKLARRMVEEYEAGESARILAERYGVHPATVWRQLAKAGVETGRRSMADDAVLLLKVRALRDAGLTLRQIATQVGASHSRIHRLLAMT